MQSQSHEATLEELDFAKQGIILQNNLGLEEMAQVNTSFSGRPAQRKPHRAAHRRVTGAIKLGYNLVEQHFNTADPICPKVILTKDPKN